MGRARINSGYRRRIRELDGQGYKAPTITRLVEEEAAKAGWVDAPSESTVRRVVRELDAAGQAQRSEHAPFRWPDSMEQAGLPWEASRVVLDYLRYSWPFRPTVGLVRWNWRIHAAAPTLTDGEKARASDWLWQREHDVGLYAEALGTAVESYLALWPWLETTDVEDIEWSGFLAGWLDANGLDWHALQPVPRLHGLGNFVRYVLRSKGLAPNPAYESPLFGPASVAGVLLTGEEDTNEG